LSLTSDITDQFQTLSDVERTRGGEAAFVEQINVTAINSRIRDNASVISSEFQTTTFGQRGRGIDLYAFTNGQLTADIAAIRDSNTLANTFFNVGTDFIRQRDNSAEADAEVSTSTTPIRIRDTSLETQDAFSFASLAVATRDISESLVSTFNSDNTFELTRGAQSDLQVQITLDIIPNVTREFDIAVDIEITQDTIGVANRNASSDLNVALIQSSVISAIYGCDMVAFDGAEVVALVGVRRRGAGDLFSVPGFRLTCDFVRARTFVIDAQSEFNIESTAIRIRPFIADTFEIITQSDITGVRVKGLFPNAMTLESTIFAIGVVRFYFFPTDFSFAVADEPLADTFFSRTRETGVNI
jgi:hypothetical protein